MRCRSKSRLPVSGLAQDAQRHLRSELVVARPASPLYRLRKLVRRNQLIVTTLAAILAGLLMGLLLAAWFVYRVSHNRPGLTDPTINLNAIP